METINNRVETASEIINENGVDKMADVALTQGPTSFVKVLHSDNKEMLVNPWCPNATFLRHIRQNLKEGFVDKNVDLDLVSLHGEVQNLKSRPKEYANKCLQNRWTYVLCKTTKTSKNGDNSITPLITNASPHHPTLVAILNKSTTSLPVEKQTSKWQDIRQGKGRMATKVKVITSFSRNSATNKKRGNGISK